MLRTYRNLPDIPTGYPLDDVWSVVVPVARTNLVTNPSFETNTTGWFASGGSIARSTARQYHGAYSLAVTPTAGTIDGAGFGLISLTSGATYAVSVKVLGVAGITYQLAILNNTATIVLASRSFVATGRWQWIYMYYSETSSTTRYIVVTKTGSTNTAVFYIDGLQVESIAAGETVSTYIDGDQLGLVPNQQPVAFFWNGTPHASSSTRSAQTRAGGMVIPFKKYGFLITAIIGLGLANVQNISTDYARIDGAYDDYTRKPPRQFTITGRFQGRTYGELRRNRSLAQYFDRDLTGQDQRLTLLRHVEDQSGRIVTSTMRALVKYESGFGGNTDNMHAETVPITFTQYLPAIMADGESGSALDVQDSVSNANYIQVLNTAGLWSAVSSGTVAGASGDVNAIVEGPDGKIYVGGAFATASGVANTSRIAYYDPTDGLFHAMGTGALNNSVNYLAIGSDGVLYAAGSFTAMGGIANTNSIAQWNGSVWSAVGTGATTGTGILAMAIDSANDLYVGGTFTGMGGVANTTRLAKWDGSAWSALSTGANGNVRALAVGAADVLYIGGDFGTLGAVAAAFVGSWNGTAFSAMSTGMDNSVVALAVGLNNVVYAGGDFGTAGGVTATRTAQWNGTAWVGMGAGLNTTVRVLTVMPDGTVWAGGGFTNSGGVSLRSPMARWNGSTWTGSDNNLVSTVGVSAITPDRAGKIYVGYSSFGTATQGGLTTVTNPGTSRSYPTVKIYGPTSGTSRIYQIVNATTGRAIYLNLTLNVGEIATLVFTPDNLSFTSDFRGNIASTILSGSNEADFFLQPGANVISALSANTTVVMVLYFRPTYTSMDDVP